MFGFSSPSCRLLLFLALCVPAAGAQPLLHTLTSPAVQTDARFGSAVAGVPDLNGDGHGDLLIGAPSEAPAGTPRDAGRVHLLSGADGVLLRTLVSPNVQNNGHFGAAVAVVPDTDGDGLADLLIGASDEETGASPQEAGRAYLFSGASGALLHTFASPDEQTDGFFGIAVSGVPDLDGDGRGDVLIGAYGETTASTFIGGRAYVFSGATGGHLRTLESVDPSPIGHFGYAVSGVPDTDGDGRGDLLVGARSEDEGSQNSVGRAYLFSGASGSHRYTLSSPDPDIIGFFGHAVSGLNDLDGDGRGDLLLGAPYEDTGSGLRDDGRAYVFSGASGALLHTLASPNAEGDGFFGFAVAAVPDADGDGADDLLIGANFEDPGDSPTDTGRAYLVSGASGAFKATLASANEQVFGQFGFAVAGVPDTDGDGRGDLLVGARVEHIGALDDAGRAYLFSGTDGPPVSVTPEATLPAPVVLHPPAPNPAFGNATILYDLPAAMPVRLAVYDALGREVAVLVEGMAGAGRHHATLDTAALPSGAYLVWLMSAGTSQTQRVTLVR